MRVAEFPKESKACLRSLQVRKNLRGDADIPQEFKVCCGDSARVSGVLWRFRKSLRRVVEIPQESKACSEHSAKV